MPNLYGVANPVVNLGFYGTIGGASVGCLPGVETNVIQSGTIVALDRGIYYPFCIATMLLQFGATLPSSLVFALRLNNGADLVSMQGFMPTDAQSFGNTFTVNFVGPASATAFSPPGSNIQVSVLVAAFQTTVAVGYSNAVLGIMRAADQ